MTTAVLQRSLAHKLRGTTLRLMVGGLICASSGVTCAAGFPILLYHRFGAQATDSTTVTTEAFESQLRVLERGGYRVIPLRQFVDYLLAEGPPPLRVRWRSPWMTATVRCIQPCCRWCCAIAFQ